METKKFQFDRFLLDPEQKVLLFEGKPVSVTPKAFHLLQVLVENHGRVLEKEFLMRTVWPDSFVEESNLTFNIWQLRKALGGCQENSKFIETVPKRGYRFGADVSIINSLDAPVVASGLPASSASNSATRSMRGLQFAGFAVIVSVLAGWFWLNNRGGIEDTILAHPFASQQLSTNGQVYHAVISPDGKQVVYTNIDRNKQSVWTRDLISGVNAELVPGTDDVYRGLAFSSDGKYLYFSRRPFGERRTPDIFRLPITGGEPQLIARDNEGVIGVSPTGDRISFVRCGRDEDRSCSLWVASAGGGNEERVVTRPAPIRIRAHAFGDDARTIFFSEGQSEDGSNDFKVSELDLETRETKDVSAEKFFNIPGIAQIPGSKDLLLAARRKDDRYFRIWRLDTSTGTTEPLTKDTHSYATLSLDSLGKNLVATTARPESKLLTFSSQPFDQGQFVADAIGGSFITNDTLVISSAITGNTEIWTVNRDGSGRRQLTSDPGDDRVPVVSPDREWIYFTSNRSDGAHVWRMRLDGTEQMQLTRKQGGYVRSISADGEWIYYQAPPTRHLWQVSSDGKREEQVLPLSRFQFAVSPDGTKAAYLEDEKGEKALKIVSLSTGGLISSQPLSIPGEAQFLIQWIPGSEAVAYVISSSEYTSNTLWLHHFNGSRPVKVAELGRTAANDFAVSPDGTSFMVVRMAWNHDAVLITGLN